MVLSSICLVHVVNEKNGAQVVAMASISKPDFVEMKNKNGEVNLLFLRIFTIFRNVNLPKNELMEITFINEYYMRRCGDEVKENVLTHHDR